MQISCHRLWRNYRRAALPAMMGVALALSGCGSGAAPAAAELNPAEINSAPGTKTWNATVIKNKFFSTQPEDCGDVQVHGGMADYNTFIECEKTQTYLWLFSDADERDAYLPEIVELGLPLLVSEDWVIASPLDLEAAQDSIGGAINRP